ncbi:MAG: ABC transporter ATP-binding protein [Verrucomicrobiota bacterium]|nr:ABC transporter ATP-binding protein [Verrucomicrobiota bacterium]
MSEPAVAVIGVTKIFPLPFQRKSIVALRDLNLNVAPGQVYGLLGPNGSGKSTTLKIILGLVSPTKGQTKIFGRDSSHVSSREEVGFLPESPYFPKYLTAREMLNFYGKLSGLPPRDLKKRVDELLELVGLTSARDRRLGGYSKGMLQRIGLAQALVHEPKLLVLDEPTAGVDPAGTREIRDLILDLKRRGHRSSFLAFARTRAGSLRSHRHPGGRRARARRRRRRIAGDRKPNRDHLRKRSP